MILRDSAACPANLNHAATAPAITIPASTMFISSFTLPPMAVALPRLAPASTERWTTARWSLAPAGPGSGYDGRSVLRTSQRFRLERDAGIPCRCRPRRGAVRAFAGDPFVRLLRTAHSGTTKRYSVLPATTWLCRASVTVVRPEAPFPGVNGDRGVHRPAAWTALPHSAGPALPGSPDHRPPPPPGHEAWWCRR
jgi:hypothetical protein